MSNRLKNIVMYWMRWSHHTVKVVGLWIASKTDKEDNRRYKYENECCTIKKMDNLTKVIGSLLVCLWIVVYYVFTFFNLSIITMGWIIFSAIHVLNMQQLSNHYPSHNRNFLVLFWSLFAINIILYVMSNGVWMGL